MPHARIGQPDHSNSQRVCDRKSPTESEKIELLITALAKLNGATFIRNGESHNVVDAIAHMRRKWSWKMDEVITAGDFIRVAATGSSATGKPYRIRFADGREVDSAKWFQAQLAEIERGEPGD